METEERRVHDGGSDAGLWRKLLQKSVSTRTTSDPYFVADVVEGCLTGSFSKIELPADFQEKYHANLTENVIVEGPDGQKWSVMLGQSWDSKPCFLQGWREFAADYKLVVGDRVVFFLWEDSHFLVQVFDVHCNIKRRGNPDPAATSTLLTKVGKDYANNSGLQNLSLGCDAARLTSDVEDEEPQAMKRSRTLKRKTEGRQGDEMYSGSFERLGGIMKLVEDMKENAARGGSISSAAQAASAASMSKLARRPTQEKKKRSATEGKGECSRKRKRKGQAKGMKTTPLHNPEAPPEATVAIKPEHKEKGESSELVVVVAETAAAGPSAVSPEPLPEVVASKPAFKRPKPRITPSPAHHKLVYVSKRRPVTTQEREATLATAKEYTKSSINKHFVMQLRDTQVYCGYHLAVPAEFVEVMQLPRGEKTTVTLFDVTGKTWEVVWMGDHPKRAALQSEGWTRFAVMHCLEEGDVCVFELPDPKSFRFYVTIFAVVPVPEDTMWRSHYGGFENSERAMEESVPVQSKAPEGLPLLDQKEDSLQASLLVQSKAPEGLPLLDQKEDSLQASLLVQSKA